MIGLSLLEAVMVGHVPVAIFLATEGGRISLASHLHMLFGLVGDPLTDVGD